MKTPRTDTLLENADGSHEFVEFSRELERENIELREVVKAALEWINAVSSDLYLASIPPKFDRDRADVILRGAAPTQGSVDLGNDD